MGYTFNWKLIGLKKSNSEQLPNAVIGTNWTVTGIDEDGNEGTFTGATPFKISEINTGSFTEYSELTEEQVLGWVKNVVSGSYSSTNYWNHIEGVISKEINSKKYTYVEVSNLDLPWSPGSGSSYVYPSDNP
jgi:hypothetical protein